MSAPVFRAFRACDGAAGAKPPARVRGLLSAALCTAIPVSRTGRGLGPGPLCHDGGHAQRVADLTTYIRQSHAERDLGDADHVGAVGQQPRPAGGLCGGPSEQLRDMGATTLSLSNTGGTDHLSFDGIGLPGFQFIQDEIEYETRTHHSNQDVFDRIQAEDMKQSAVSRRKFFASVVDTDTLILPVHFPKPTIGLIKPHEDGFDYRFKRD